MPAEKVGACGSGTKIVWPPRVPAGTLNFWGIPFGARTCRTCPGYEFGGSWTWKQPAGTWTATGFGAVYRLVAEYADVLPRLPPLPLLLFGVDLGLRIVMVNGRPAAWIISKIVSLPSPMTSMFSTLVMTSPARRPSCLAQPESGEAKVRCVEHHDCPANGPSKACCVSAVCGVADPADPNGANAFDYQQGLTAARREAMCAPLEAQDLLGGGNCNSLAKYEGGLSEWVHHYAVLLVAVTGAMLAFLFADLACTYCFIRDIGRRAQLEKDSAAYEMATQTPVTADSAEREARSFFGSAEKKKRPKKKKKKKKPPADTDPLTEEQSTSSFSQV